MPQRYNPGDLITADIINDILTRLDNLATRLATLEDRKNHAKETKEKEKDGAKESKEKDTKESKEKDTKESKEKDTKESKDTKDTKEKDTKETKDTKDTKEKDTKESKEKDTKESKDTKDTKEQSKDTKETKEGKENKENKEEKEEKEQKDRSKEFLSLKEKESNRDQIPAPYSPNAPPAIFGLDAAPEEEEEASGHAFIAEDERPPVGRMAFELADKQSDKLPESNTAGKQAEAFN